MTSNTFSFHLQSNLQLCLLACKFMELSLVGTDPTGAGTLKFTHSPSFPGKNWISHSYGPDPKPTHTSQSTIADFRELWIRPYYFSLLLTVKKRSCWNANPISQHHLLRAEQCIPEQIRIRSLYIWEFNSKILSAKKCMTKYCLSTTEQFSGVGKRNSCKC